MRQSTCFTMTIVFTAAAIAALIFAVVCDAMNNSDKSIIFGCIACACAVPAFSSALLLFQSGIDSMKTPKHSEIEFEEVSVDKAFEESPEENNVE